MSNAFSTDLPCNPSGPTEPIVREEKVHVVIVNYRTPDMVLQCLHSLAMEREQVPGLKVSVVDNDSGDGSVTKLQVGITDLNAEKWAEVLDHGRNPGFGAGNNLALRDALAAEDVADYFLILNPDTEIRPGAIATLCAYAADHPEAAILGPRTESTPGTADHTAFRFPGFLNGISDGLRFGPVDRLLARWVTAPPPRDVAHRSDWVSGGCMFVRKDVLQTCGIFDEHFFLYFEETDLCHRALRHGFQTWYLPEAVIMHWAGASTGIATAGRPPKRMPGWWFASRRHYLRNFHNPLYLLACDLAFLATRSLWQLRAWITRIEATDPPHFLWDFTRYNLFGRRWDRPQD